MNDYLIDDIRRTLRTAAERIDVTPPSFDSSIDTQPVKAVTPRWVWPTAVAAAVIAVALVLVAFVIPAVGDRRHRRDDHRRYRRCGWRPVPGAEGVDGVRHQQHRRCSDGLRGVDADQRMRRRPADAGRSGQLWFRGAPSDR